MAQIKVTEMAATDRGRKVRIFVSEIMRNEDCEDGRRLWGYWWCVKGGEVGYFSTHRPTSGCSIGNVDANTNSRVEDSIRDIFNVNDPIDTKERFAELIINE